METYKLQAIDKLYKEQKDAKCKDNKAKAVLKPTAETLLCFCKQDEEFAQAIVQSDKTLSACCDSIMKNCGNAISDLEVYKRAVQFYFPGADIDVKMSIDLCATVKSDSPEAADRPAGGKVIDFSLADLFD